MNIRKAENKDLSYIVALIADDELGKTREDFRDPLPEEYWNAFNSISKDANQQLMVLEGSKGEILGCLQLSFLQYLTYRGGVRAQIEAVRVRKDKRGLGLGKMMFEWAINRAKERNAHVVQLTTDKKRPEAFKFYKDLGFNDSHEGMKLHFNGN